MLDYNAMRSNSPTDFIVFNLNFLMNKKVVSFSNSNASFVCLILIKNH